MITAIHIEAFNSAGQRECFIRLAGKQLAIHGKTPESAQAAAVEAVAQIADLNLSLTNPEIVTGHREIGKEAKPHGA